MAEQVVKKSSPLLIALAWLIVVIPAGWGLNFTVQNALKLFHPAPPAAAAPASPTNVPAAPAAAH